VGSSNPIPLKLRQQTFADFRICSAEEPDPLRISRHMRYRYPAVRFGNDPLDDIAT
jgi:hypothetical protein